MEILTFFDVIITSKQAWVYILFGEIGLAFGIGNKILTENRRIKWKDFFYFLVWSLFVAPTCLLLDFSPFFSFLIGIFQDKVLTFLKTKVDEGMLWLDDFSIKELISKFIIRNEVPNKKETDASKSKRIEEPQHEEDDGKS